MPSDFLTNRHMAKLGMPPQSVSWSEGPLTFDGVSKFFSVPIAEAAQKLSVCTSVLKRICKENGVPRWPYRKVIAGKTIQDIKEEGLKEMAAKASAFKKSVQHPEVTPEVLKPPAVVTAGTSPSEIPQLTTQLLVNRVPSGTPTPQAGVASTQHPQTQQNSMPTEAKSPVLGYSPSQRMMAQGTATADVNSPASHGRSPVIASGGSPSQTTPKSKTAATTLHDDFKVGFPSKSLSATTLRWWGSGERDSSSAGKTAGDAISTLGEVGGSGESLVDCTGDDDVASEVGPSTTASSLLVKTRKKAAARGRSALGHAVTRKYGIHKLGAKDADTLRFVFGDHLPKQWNSAFPPVPQ